MNKLTTALLVVIGALVANKAMKITLETAGGPTAFAFKAVGKVPIVGPVVKLLVETAGNPLALAHKAVGLLPIRVAVPGAV